MADVVSVSALTPTVVLPSTTTTRARAVSLERQISVCISTANWTHLKMRAPCRQTALKSRSGSSSSPLLRGPAANPSLIPQDARGVAVAPIASSSREAGASNGGEDDNDENRSGCSPRDGFGLYPWDPSWQAMDLDDLPWIQEETITLFTSEGVVKLGGSRLVFPRASYNEMIEGLLQYISANVCLLQRKYAHLRELSRLRRYREEDYMDPKQGLCLGAIFDIAATNGLDMGRRFCVFGFCRSIEMLSDVVQDTVLGQGGEVVIAEKGSTTGLHEKLSMTVAMPALWGVPPAFDVLNSAIRSGGGIVEKTYKKWEFF